MRRKRMRHDNTNGLSTQSVSEKGVSEKGTGQRAAISVSGRPSASRNGGNPINLAVASPDAHLEMTLTSNRKLLILRSVKNRFVRFSAL